MNGVCRLTIKSATLEDSGEYICKINKQTDKTETVLTVVGAFLSWEKKKKFFSKIKILRDPITWKRKKNFVRFLCAEYPYKFVKVLKSQQLVEKETLTLVCELDDAGGEVKWFKGDQEIVPDKRWELLIINLRPLRFFKFVKKDFFFFF